MPCYWENKYASLCIQNVAKCFVVDVVGNYLKVFCNISVCLLLFWIMNVCATLFSFPLTLYTIILFWKTSLIKLKYIFKTYILRRLALESVVNRRLCYVHGTYKGQNVVWWPDWIVKALANWLADFGLPFAIQLMPLDLH